MKKFILFLCCFLVAALLLLGVLIFAPFSAPPPYEIGPKVFYRVEEGAVDVFSLMNGEVGSLLSYVKAGETFMARPVSKKTLKTPIWLDWTEPLMVEVVERTNLFLRKESEKAPPGDFAVGFTNESIQRGFTRELEQSQILSNVRINFHSDGFSLFARSRFISISFRGYASTQGTSDHLFLHLRWVKVGEIFLPEHVLRALENIFSKAYFKSRHPSVKILRINFNDNLMVVYCRKDTGDNTGAFRTHGPANPKIIFPYGS